MGTQSIEIPDHYRRFLNAQVCVHKQRALYCGCYCEAPSIPKVHKEKKMADFRLTKRAFLLPIYAPL